MNTPRTIATAIIMTLTIMFGFAGTANANDFTLPAGCTATINGVDTGINNLQRLNYAGSELAEGDELGTTCGLTISQFRNNGRTFDPSFTQTRIGDAATTVIMTCGFVQIDATNGLTFATVGGDSGNLFGAALISKMNTEITDCTPAAPTTTAAPTTVPAPAPTTTEAPAAPVTTLPAAPVTTEAPATTVAPAPSTTVAEITLTLTDEPCDTNPAVTADSDECGAVITVPAGTDLPLTGSSTTQPLAIGAGIMVLIGSGLVLVSRR